MAEEKEGMDEDSIKALDVVKKGKPHKFVMLCKGVKIQKLIVFRKGQPSSMVQKAKKEGFSGTTFAGVVTGKGQVLTFELSAAEGYDAPPGKELILKDFLKTAADFKCQPEYRIVTELTAVEDETLPPAGPPAPGAQPTAPVAAASPTAPPAAPPPPASPSDEAGRLTTRLKALMPAIKAAQDSPGGERVKLLASEVGVLGRKQDFGQANRLLDEIEKMLNSAPSGPAQPSGAGQALSPDFPRLWQQAKAVWQAALDTVNGQLEKLRGELLKEGDTELKRIAEFGLNAITGDHKVPLQAAIVEVDGAAPGNQAQAVAQAKELVTEFRDHLDTDERVEACDDNPFDVKVTIRATLDPALAQMEQALNQAFAA